jgi:hypothetical protein
MDIVTERDVKFELLRQNPCVVIAIGVATRLLDFQRFAV